MLLKLDHVQKQYQQFQLDCSLELKTGYITGLIGANAAGKSTTFKSILGLTSIDGGKIELFGKDYKKVTEKERAQIGVVLNDSGFSGYLKVKDLLPILSGLYPTFQKEAFTEQCSKFQVPMNQQIKEFSTGMKAKLKVLIALSHDSKLLLLDEPTSGLDVMARDDILNLLRVYMELGEHAILISSHISSDLEGLCDDVYMIHQGKIILHEETNVLLDQYGLLKLSKEEYEKLDRRFVVRRKEESFGYACLVKEKQFYLDNYPALVMEKGNIDEIILLMERGEAV